jgi:hypothetical protein
MKFTLKAWLVKNQLNNGNKTDNGLMLESTGHYDLERVIKRMNDEQTGMREETIRHNVHLYHRVITEILSEGNSVNTGLFHAIPRLRGFADGDLWNPEKNSVYISFTQDKELRDAMTNAKVHVLGFKGSPIFISEARDSGTDKRDGTATIGYSLTLYGRMLKVVGDHPSVGITLTNEADGQTLRMRPGHVMVNYPRRIMLQIPEDLPEGRYVLTITTQFSNKNVLLKRPRSTAIVINAVAPSHPGPDADNIPTGMLTTSEPGC